MIMLNTTECSISRVPYPLRKYRKGSLKSREKAIYFKDLGRKILGTLGFSSASGPVRESPFARVYEVVKRGKLLIYIDFIIPSTIPFPYPSHTLSLLTGASNVP
jgi:hypothetical protein